MSDQANDELGRSKTAASPGEHLQHLLTIGWSPASPLIAKYVGDNGLQRQLSEWLAANNEAAPAKKR